MEETAPQGNDFNYEFSDANRRIPGFPLERVQNARVLLLGIGALGNETLKNLALFDIGYLYLCDLDIVEWANLSHSVLFRKEDNGIPKVEAAARAIRQLNPRIQVKTFHCPLSGIGLGVWRNVDMVVGGLDNRGSRLLIDRQCAKVGKDWIDAGLGSMISAKKSANDILHGVVQRFSPRQGYCYEYYLQGDSIMAEATREMNAMKTWKGCFDLDQEKKKHQRVPTTPAMSSLIGAIKAQEVIRGLCPDVWGAGGLGYSRLTLDADTYAFRQMQHPQGEAQLPLAPVISLPHLSARTTTVAEIVAFVKDALGPRAVIDLGFNYCSGLICSSCQERDATPFKINSRSSDCPQCGTERGMIPPISNELNGSEPFREMTLLELGIPLFDILTAKVKRSDGSIEVRHYELAGDAAELL